MRGFFCQNDWDGVRWLSGRASDSAVQNLPLPCCVLEQDTLIPECTGNTQEAMAPFRLTEILLSGTLSTNKQTNKTIGQYSKQTT